MRLPILAVLLIAVAGLAAQPAGFVVNDHITTLTQPTAMAFDPSGKLWVCEKTGAVKVFSGQTQVSTFVTIAVSTQSERGVLGIAFDPDFATNRFVYIYYTTSPSSLDPPATPKNRVSRFTELNNQAVPGSETILLDDIPSDAGNHNAGCLRFGIDGKLYIATGDGGATPSNSQNLNNLAGKILRINPDGTVPSDNPFFSQPPKRPEIWLYGLRNPFRFVFRPGTLVPYVADVGAGTWEEVNVGPPGSNFGWPTHEGSSGGATGFVDPIHAYNHNGQGASITGGCFVGTRWPLAYQSRYMFGDYVLDDVRWLEVNGANQAVADGAFMGLSGPVDFGLGPDGALYIVTINLQKVVRVAYRPVPANMSAPAAVYGGVGGQASVNLDVAAPAGGQVVNLESDDPVILQVPVSTTVAAGSTSKAFNFTTAGVDANTPVTITATCNGTSATGTVTVLRANMQALNLNPLVVVGGDPSTGTVELNGEAGPSGLTISLSSGNPTLAQVPASLSIPAGASSGSFTITTIGVASQQVVSINSTLGAQSLQTTLTLQQALYLVNSITLNPSTVVSSFPSSGRVVINRAAGAGGQQVQILDNASAVTTPPFVTVPEGATAVNFPIQTSAVNSTFGINVQAQIGTSIRRSTLTLLPCPIYGLAIFPTNVPGGINANGRVTLRNVAPGGGAFIALAEYSNYTSVPPSVTVPAGQTIANFPITTLPVGANVVVTVTATYQGAVKKTTFTVTNALVLKAVSVSPNSIVGGQSTTGTVTLNKAVGSGTFTVAVSDNLSATSMPPSVVLGVGQASKNFTITSAPVGASYNAVITASADGIVKTTTLTVHP